GFVLDDFRHEAVHDLGHGPELLRALGQQPRVQRPALDADAPREDIARQIQATHGIAKKHLLGNRHEGTLNKYTQRVYFIFRHDNLRAFSYWWRQNTTPPPLNTAQYVST